MTRPHISRAGVAHYLCGKLIRSHTGWTISCAVSATRHPKELRRQLNFLRRYSPRLSLPVGIGGRMSGLKPRGRSRIELLSRRLMGASSYLCLALLLGRPAPALAGNTEPPPAIFDNASAPFREHWFFSLEGGYAANASPSNLGFSPSDPYLSYLTPLRPGADGGFVGATIGHTMGPEWDAALSYHATLFGKSSENITASPPPVGFDTSNALTASASSGLWYQTFDAEVGYHPPAWLAENVRVFFGPRILTAHSSINYGFNDSGTDLVIGIPGDVRQAWQLFARHRPRRHRTACGIRSERAACLYHRADHLRHLGRGIGDLHLGPGQLFLLLFTFRVGKRGSGDRAPSHHLRPRRQGRARLSHERLDHDRSRLSSRAVV